jgi:hypothetical protein
MVMVRLSGSWKGETCGVGGGRQDGVEVKDPRRKEMKMES